MTFPLVIRRLSEGLQNLSLNVSTAAPHLRLKQSPHRPFVVPPSAPGRAITQSFSPPRITFWSRRRKSAGSFFVAMEVGSVTGLLVARQPVHQREQHARDHEGHMDNDLPHQLITGDRAELAAIAKLEKALQQRNARDRDD